MPELELGKQDKLLMTMLPNYHLAFSTKYAGKKMFFIKIQIFAEHICSTPGCKTIVVMDGNMKNHRDVCKATEAGYSTFDGLPGQVKTGCQKTPDFKSRYCYLHKPRVCAISEDQEDEATSLEGVVEMILETKVTRKTTYYKVIIH